jgi:hypothetical protein
MMKINTFYSSMKSHGSKIRGRNTSTTDCTPRGMYPNPGPLKHGGIVGK